MITKTILIRDGVTVMAPKTRVSDTVIIEIDGRNGRADAVWNTVATRGSTGKETYVCANERIVVDGVETTDTNLYASIDGVWQAGHTLDAARNSITSIYADHGRKSTNIRVAAPAARHFSDIVGASFVTLVVDGSTLEIRATFL